FTTILRRRSSWRAPGTPASADRKCRWRWAERWASCTRRSSARRSAWRSRCAPRASRRRGANIAIQRWLSYGKSQHGDLDGAQADLRREGEILDAALEIGRSDPELLETACERYLE